MNSLISVIIPVYNVEKYVERCVESVLHQTYKNIEVILVDDGSTDCSGEICDSLAKKDKRIIVVHQNNQGLGPARNTGLNRIKGEYVSFVDSDDWIHSQTYEVLLAELIFNQCEIATCGRIVNDNGKKQYVYCMKKGIVLEREDALKFFLLQRNINMSACDKLYKASLFDDIRFPGKHLVSEDIVPIYRAIDKSKRIVLTGKPFYNYCLRDNSLSKKSFDKKCLGTLIYSKKVASNVVSFNPSLKAEADYFWIDSLICTYRRMRSSNYKEKEAYTLYYGIIRILKTTMVNNYFNIKQKIYVILVILKIDTIPNRFYEYIKGK